MKTNSTETKDKPVKKTRIRKIKTTPKKVEETPQTNHYYFCTKASGINFSGTIMNGLRVIIWETDSENVDKAFEAFKVIMSKTMGMAWDVILESKIDSIFYKGIITIDEVSKDGVKSYKMDSRTNQRI